MKKSDDFLSNFKNVSGDFLSDCRWVLDAPAPAEASGPRPEVAFAAPNRDGGSSRPLAGSLHGAAQTLAGEGSWAQGNRDGAGKPSWSDGVRVEG